MHKTLISLFLIVFSSVSFAIDKQETVKLKVPISTAKLIDFKRLKRTKAETAIDISPAELREQIERDIRQSIKASNAKFLEESVLITDNKALL